MNAVLQRSAEKKYSAHFKNIARLNFGEAVLSIYFFEVNTTSVCIRGLCETKLDGFPVEISAVKREPF